MKKILTLLVIIFLVVVGFLLLRSGLMHSEEHKEAMNSAEAAGSVALNKAIKAMEEYVGKSDLALEHYKRVQKERREALVTLKTLRLEAERKKTEAGEEEKEYRDKGKTEEADSRKKRAEMYSAKIEELKKSESSADEKYKDFNVFYEKKKMEIEMLASQLAMLKTEMSAAGSGEESLSLKKAKELENEMKAACSKLEAQIEVYSKE